jgi:V8-like Glu-specific endopeptidase
MKSSTLARNVVALALVAGTCGVSARADEPILPELRSVVVPVEVDSGLVGAMGSAEEWRVVFATGVHVPGAEWLRLRFGETTLAGDPGADGAYLRVTSVVDGSQQVLNAESLGWWGGTSAFFNGDEVIVEVLARGGSGDSRVRVVAAEAGHGVGGYGDRSICGTTDDRTLSTTKGNARLLSVGCTAWIINDVNRQFMTAGHCTVTATSVVQFNVPLSSATGAIQHPPATDQFPAQLASSQGVGGGVGNDWRYFGVMPNSNTGITAFQHQGEFYTLAAAAPAVAGQTIRVTGYGTVSSPVSPTWNQVQKTHQGPYVSMVGTTIRYAMDTTGGNSGSPVLNVNTGQAIGVHTHAGCTSSGGSNQGTAIHHPNLQTALNNPLGVCRSGLAPATGSIMVVGDLNNNIGTVGTTTAEAAFGKLGVVARTFQGLATDHQAGVLYGIDSTRALWQVAPEGSTALLGTVTGTTLSITGLAFHQGVLYGIAGATGQLFTINPVTRAASAVGSPSGGNVAGLEFDHGTGVLYALDDSTGATRLMTISTSTGAATLVGPLGTGTDCNGLAFDAATGQLFTIDAPTGRLLRVSPATGAATVVGMTNGSFGSAFGMAASPVTGCVSDYDGDGDWGTDADIEAFFRCLAGNCCPTCASADFNMDGSIGTDADIESFFRVLAGGPC